MAKKVGKSSSVRPYMLRDLTGGINVAQHPEFLQDNECTLLENFEFDSQGNRLRTRRGLGRPLHTFNGNKIEHIFNDYEMNMFFIFTSDKSIYKYVANKDKPTLIGKLNGVSEKPICCKFDNKLLIASGMELQVYDYQSLQTVTNSPKCDIVFERFGRVVVTKAGQDKLFYSGIGDLHNWTPNSNDLSASKDVDVGYKDGGDILGIVELETDVIVFKSNGLIYDVQNEPEEWNIIKLGNESDFLSRHACINLNKDAVFLSSDGLRSLTSSMEYANFERYDIGVKINPNLLHKLDKPFISNLRRTKQLIVSGASKNELYVYHYALKAFTKWTFSGSVTSICEGEHNTLVAMNDDNGNGSIYELSKDNEFDVTPDGKINQWIISKEFRDTHDMNVYRVYIDVQSKHSGKGNIYIVANTTPHKIDYEWTEVEQQKEFKTQIIAPRLVFKFHTDDVIEFKYVNFDIVYQRESMVTDKGTNGKISQIKPAKRRSASHKDFLKDIKKKVKTPYG